MVTFKHDDAGTAESDWVDAGIEDLSRLEPGVVPGRGERLVVVAAHPDDESLGAAGLIHTALCAGATVHVIVCTSGEASHPDSPTHSRDQLAELRSTELDTALAILRDGAPDPDGLGWQQLGLPDGELSRHANELEEALEAALDGHSGGATSSTGPTRVVIAAPYRHDAHTDHDAAGMAASRVAARRRAGLLEFPIWYWHWATPQHTQWHGWSALPLGSATRELKKTVLGAHRSQISALSPAAGDEVLLSEAFQQHFERSTETFRWTAPGPRDSTSAAHIFDDLYRRHPDPWDYLGSRYEHRKRSVTLASLPRDHYQSAVEAGCSIGVLTIALAERCSHLLGIDASDVALDAARRRVADVPNVSLLRAELPGGWPLHASGTLDLVVMSEIGYFLGRHELHGLLDTVAHALRPGGDLLLCHWLHPIEGWELDGQEVHDLATSLGWRRVVRHEEEDFLLDVLRAPGGDDEE